MCFGEMSGHSKKSFRVVSYIKCSKLSIWGCFTSNTKRARAFRMFPFVMLALFGFEYLIYPSKDRNSSHITVYDHTLDDKNSICLANIRKLMKKGKQGNPRDGFFESATKNVPLCVMPLNLGHTKVNRTNVSLEEVDSKYPEVSWGGWYNPTKCKAKYRVAIIIPYRDRRAELAVFLNNIHPFLMAQEMIEYAIFVVEQSAEAPFNRGKLLNIGYIESDELRPGAWQCFIFHDVDLLPLNTKNLYNCDQWPKHMAVGVDVSSYRLRHKTTVGGVVALRREHMLDVNGFSNMFWGWGGEDIDMYHRLKLRNYAISRYHISIARYSMVHHPRQEFSDERLEKLKKKAKDYTSDGLNTINYKIRTVCQNHLFTHILVKIDMPPHELPTSLESYDKK